jgi:hypothetical protein
MYNVNSRTISTAAGWDRSFCGCSASSVTLSNESPLAANEGASVSVVAHGTKIEFRKEVFHAHLFSNP